MSQKKVVSIDKKNKKKQKNFIETDDILKPLKHHQPSPKSIFMP